MWSYLFIKNTTKIKISASQRISIKNCMNYDHNRNFGLFKFQSGYSKLYLNSPKGFSRKIISAQTDTDIKPIPDIWLALFKIPTQHTSDIVKLLGRENAHLIWDWKQQPLGHQWLSTKVNSDKLAKLVVSLSTQEF